MCGIVGISSSRDVTNIILQGLKTLEYRGYDSAGIAVINGSGLKSRKALGKVSNLEQLLTDEPISGPCGIGHTRWATHGAPAVKNAHPHISRGRVAVVHNGIIENSHELRDELILAGYQFDSDTDTEVIAHLIHSRLARGDDFVTAARSACDCLQGAYALAILCTDFPDLIIAIRKGSPLVIGAGDGEHYVASDIAAVMGSTSSYYYLEEGDMAEIYPMNCVIYDSAGQHVERVLHQQNQQSVVVSKGQYQHFMLKEIHDQHKVASQAIQASMNESGLKQDFLPVQIEQALQQCRCIHIVACGSSWHAGCVAKYWLESIAGIPCSVEVASEYRYRHPAIPEQAVFVAISQSGETADTLAAMRYAKAGGYLATLSICNRANSTMCRESDAAVLTHAGVEVGVASTKAVTAQLIMLALLCLRCAELKAIKQTIQDDLIKQLHQLPMAIARVLKLEPQIKEMATKMYRYQNALFLGRGAQYPIAMEGALKLKEISYIHAEAYAAGELKHGPLALIDQNMPVVALCPCDELMEKVKANLSEVRSRGGHLFVLTSSEDSELCETGIDFTLIVPSPGMVVAPIIYNIPLQLLAYHIALLRGTDIDQPRNLAKSVTVE